MRADNYVSYLEGTFNMYPDKLKHHIRRIFRSNDLRLSESKAQECKGESSLSLEQNDSNNQIMLGDVVRLIKENNQAVKLFEKWEFEKDYKYSALFKSNNFDEIIDKLDSSEKSEDGTEAEGSIADAMLLNPICKKINETTTMLKFNLFFSAIHPQTANELLLKYPFLVVFHKKEKIIEFRFDVLKKIFVASRQDSNFYAELIRKGIQYLEEDENVKLEPMNLEFIINEAKTNKKLKLVAQYMQLSSGGNAHLEVGNNEEYIMPFIGDLKVLIEENMEEFNKVPSLKEALDQFIYEKEEMSNYPWVEVLWVNEIKTRSIHVKFVFNYMNNSYCLLQHYYNNVLIGMERMDHVIEFIGEDRGDNPQK